MNKTSERILKKQQKREMKRLKEIEAGTLVHITYEERKNKNSIPNRKSEAKTVEEELAHRQDTAEKATIIYRQLLPGLLNNLSKIKDPRKPERIKHKMTVVMAYGILLFVFHINSRRNANKILSLPIFFENFKYNVSRIENTSPC